MMHAVRGRRVEYVFEQAELRRPRIVNPELVPEIDRQHEHRDMRLHAEPDERHEEKAHAGEIRRPAKPIGGGKRQLVRRMMDRVRRPHQAYTVRRAVIPVVAEFLREKYEQQRRHRMHRHRMDAVTPCEREHRRSERERRKVDQFSADHIEQRQPHFVPVEPLAAAVPVSPFQHERFGKRNADEDHRDDIGELEGRCHDRRESEQFQGRENRVGWLNRCVRTVASHAGTLESEAVKNHRQTMSRCVMHLPLKRGGVFAEMASPRRHTAT